MFFPRITSCLLGTCCLVSSIFAWHARCEAQIPPRRPFSMGTRQAPTQPDVAPATSVQMEAQIRLNHVQATWRRVLEELAKSMNIALVMPEEPPGYFSRLDRSLHSHPEALRILNHELEPRGFRLLAKGGYLLVLELDAGRPKYKQATFPADPGPTAVAPLRTAASSVEISPAETSARPVPVVALSPGFRAEPTSFPAAAPSPALRRLPPTRSDQGHQFPVRQAGLVQMPAPAAVDETTLRLAMKQQRADLVAARIRDACRDWTTPMGQPSEPLAFRVALRGASQPPTMRPDGRSEPVRSSVQFAVTTDISTNQLVVQTSPRFTSAVTRLVQSFDTPNIRPGTSERLIAGVSDATTAAERIQSPLNALRRQQAPPRVAALQPQGELAPPADVPQQRRSNALETIEQLRGDVTVDVIEDLGVLILRGDSNDVDAVANLVSEIEKLGVEAGPEVHLLMLSFVNSESLTELLGGVFERPKSSGANKPGAAVSVTAVRSPNALLIVAPAAQMPTVLELAAKLDQPGDPSAVFRVFALKQAVAGQVLGLLEDFYEPKGGLAARIKAVVDVRTNSLIVRGAPRDLDEVAALIERIDRDESQAVNQMRVFPLKNASADQLVEVINTALRSALTDSLNLPGGQTQGGTSAPGGGGERTAGAAGANRQAQAAKSVVLQFLTADGVSQQRVRSGILSDIRASADARTNSLVVTAPEQSMMLMAELIRQLDTPTALVAEIKVFTLANADATAMARLLETLFSSPSQQQQLGVQVAGAEGASSSLIPMKFSVDVRTNSILATGGAEALRVMEAILLRLDQSDLRQRRSIVYRLRNSPARDVSDAINQFLASQRDLSQADPNLVSAVEQVEREVIVVPELVSNSLLISSTPRYYEEILELTEQLDQPPAQVIIQALLVEVVLDNNDEFGVELGVQDSVLFDRSAISDIVTVTDTVFDSVTGLPVSSTERIVSQAAVPGFAFNNQPLGNNPAINTSTVGGQGLSSFGLGRVSSDLGYGGLVLSAGSQSVNVLVRALAARRKIDVLSRPQIRTLDNQPAMIQVGQQVPIVDGVAISGTGSANPVVRQDQAGIILSVTPRISPDEIIVMEVSAEKSQFTGKGVPLFTDANTGNVIESPVKDVITARTTISVPNGQTVVLGGMITTLDDVTERKVPWLGDIPLLGRAFRHDIARTRRTELLIFLTPRVIHNTLDSEMIKQVEAARLHYVECAAEEVHGPLFGVPEETGLPSPTLRSMRPEAPVENLELRSSPTDTQPVPQLADPIQP